MTMMTGALPAPPLTRVRLIGACTVGNALEFYDFVIYSFFASTIGALFFPAQDPTVQLLLSFATYGVGFFCVRWVAWCLAPTLTAKGGRQPPFSPCF